MVRILWLVRLLGFRGRGFGASPEVEWRDVTPRPDRVICPWFADYLAVLLLPPRQ